MSSNNNWSHRMYCKSQIEHDLVSARAKILGKSVSTYLRDLAVIDLHTSGFIKQRVDNWTPDVVQAPSPPALDPQSPPSHFPDRLFADGELDPTNDNDSLLEEIKKSLSDDGGVE